MKLIYLAHARIPTQKAHGFTIVKSCEAFARAGAEVTLVLPNRETGFDTEVFEEYRVEKIFKVRRVPVIDMLKISASRGAFWLSYISFLWSAFWLLARMPKKDTVLYVREAPLLLLTLVGIPAILECHSISRMRRMYFFLLRRARGVVVISQALKRAFLAAGVPESRLLVAPSGVDLSIFSKEMSREEARRQLELPESEPLLVYTGNFTTMAQDKGISDILRALTQVPGARFAAVGGSEKDRAHYRAMADALGVGGRVILRGHAPQSELAVYQQAADVLLMPFPDMPHYRHHMSPVKMFEYMASHRPIIATELPTITEILHDGTAVLVPPGNPDALAAAACGLLTESDRGARLAAQAFADAHQFSWEERTKRVLAFIYERR